MGPCSYCILETSVWDIIPLIRVHKLKWEGTDERVEGFSNSAWKSVLFSLTALRHLMSRDPSRGGSSTSAGGSSRKRKGKEPAGSQPTAKRRKKG